MYYIYREKSGTTKIINNEQKAEAVDKFDRKHWMDIVATLPDEDQDWANHFSTVMNEDGASAETNDTASDGTKWNSCMEKLQQV